MKLDCPRCGEPTQLDDQAAGRTVRCAACGKSFVAPQELAIIGQRHSLVPFPAASLVLLHFVSAGFFTIIYLNLMHERMPRLRRDDPSATVAIGLCFVPVFNLYWFYFSYRRLCERIDEQRQLNGLPPSAPQWLSFPMCALFAAAVAASFFSPMGLYLLATVEAIAIPAFAVLVQNSVNELCSRQPDAASATV